jgi:hypothetical protein
LLSTLAASAEAAGTPHSFGLLSDLARLVAGIGVTCMLLGWLRNRRWRREAQQPA